MATFFDRGISNVPFAILRRVESCGVVVFGVEQVRNNPLSRPVRRVYATTASIRKRASQEKDPARQYSLPPHSAPPHHDYLNQLQ